MNVDWQEWVVALLIVACVARVVLGIRSFFYRARKKENPCASCASGCELKNQFDKKRQECKESQPSPKKNCCG